MVHGGVRSAQLEGAHGVGEPVLLPTGTDPTASELSSASSTPQEMQESRRLDAAGDARHRRSGAITVA